MLKITFALDQENDGIEVRHDGKQVFWDSAPDGWTSYFRCMPRGVPVLVEFDNGDLEQDKAEDPRPYPDGLGTDARFQRWLVDNGADPRIRDIEYDDEDRPVSEAEDVTLRSDDLYDLMHRLAQRMYWHGVDDVRGSRLCRSPSSWPWPRSSSRPRTCTAVSGTGA